MKFIGSVSWLLVAATVGNLVPVPSMAQPAIEPTPFVLASGLEGPRGLRFGPDGYLYVAEAGTGGPTSTIGQCVQVPASPFAGKVVRVKRSGEIEDVITGLFVPTGMTFGPDGRLYVSNFGAAPAGLGQILRFDIAPGW
jgi:glucose/arabinose dehydrogenase